MRTHFRDNYNRWLSETTCFSYLKTGHVSKNYPTTTTFGPELQWQAVAIMKNNPSPNQHQSKLALIEQESKFLYCKL